jgi:hypothetical protein
MISDETVPDILSEELKNALQHPSLPLYLIIPPEGPIRMIDGATTPNTFLSQLKDLGK